MSDRKSILFFTNSDFGQVNVVLAVVYELLVNRHPQRNQLQIHIASWPNLKERLDNLMSTVRDENPSRNIPAIQFHNLALFPKFGEFLEKNKGRRKADVPHPPGRLGAERIELLTTKSLAVWEPDQYLSLFDWAAELTQKVNPALVVLDPFLIPIHDMARYWKIKYAVLSPCTLADGLIPIQPFFASLWKYPAFATGFHFPLPWSKLWDNLLCNWTAKKCKWDPKVKAINQARYARGIKEPLGSFTPWIQDVPHISPSLAAIDLPMKIPSNVHNVGPIVLASGDVKIVDPELFTWLEQRPTVLLVLGTHFEAYEETIKELAIGLRMLLDARPDIQVLWKLKAESDSENKGNHAIKTILGDDITNGRVRIEGWLKADPVAILTSGHVICSVHHGGANSYFEAALAGVPQVVLPMWYDTYDYATRAEYLGIGVYGNRHAGNNCVVDMKNYVAPLMIAGQEFGGSLLKAVGATKGEAADLRKRAAKIGKICQSSGGRTEAAQILSDLCLN